jgi:hypothetical protein
MAGKAVTKRDWHHIEIFFPHIIQIIMLRMEKFTVAIELSGVYSDFFEK